MKRITRDTKNWWSHSEGISELIDFIAETMNDEMESGGILGEMYSMSGDDQPTVKEDINDTESTITMSLWSPFDLPYTTGHEFMDKNVQQDYDAEVEKFADLAKKDGIPYDSEEWLNEFMDYFSYDSVNMDLICRVIEYPLDKELDITFELYVNNTFLGNSMETFKTSDLYSGKCFKYVTSTIKKFYSLV